MDIDPKQWFEIVSHNPVILVLLGGMLFGIGFTQVIKKTWLAFGNKTSISPARYDASVMWLSIISTYLGTHLLWLAIIPIDTHGLNRIASLVAGFASPKTYDWGRALIAWKFPALAAKLGNGAVNDKT